VEVVRGVVVVVGGTLIIRGRVFAWAGIGGAGCSRRGFRRLLAAVVVAGLLRRRLSGRAMATAGAGAGGAAADLSIHWLAGWPSWLAGGLAAPVRSAGARQQLYG
jgi:hypothetical protein